MTRRPTTALALVSIALSLAAFDAAASAQGAPAGRPPAARQQQPSPIVVTPETVDLGVVAPGSTNPGRFILVNRGATPIKMLSAIPNCKCTAITPVEGKVIEAGGTFELSASLAAPRVPGDKEAVVFLTFEGAPPAQAKIKGEVRLPILATPPFVDALREVVNGTVTLKSVDGKPFTILRSGGAAPAFIGFDPAKDAPRAEYTVAWSLAGRAATDMPLWWFVWTDREDCDVIPLRVRDEATGSRHDMDRFKRFWIVKESLVMAGRGSVGAPHKGEIELEHYNPPKKGAVENPAWREAKSVRSLNADVEVRLVGRRDAGADGTMLEVEFTAKRAGPIEGLLEIETATGKGTVPFAFFAGG
ncbi:MAG: DUF1573 domain-containing protein [Phycisphaera sp.]|nr:DUF1573 domain-containing protein [Phycisphaera sp.]